MSRTINLGADASDASYQIRDTSDTGGDLVIEHLPSGATFEYDATNNRWKPTDPIDLNTNDLEDGSVTVYDASTDTVGDGANTSADHASVSTDETHTETIGANSQHYAGDYPGSDANARLDNALSAAVQGDRIWLENATYSADRTVGTGQIVISGPSFRTGAEITGSWTLNGGQNAIQNVLLGTGGSITLTTVVQTARDVYDLGNGITVQADNCGVFNCYNVSVTFESGTSGGLVDGCLSASVTDNGSNTVGDTT